MKMTHIILFLTESLQDHSNYPFINSIIQELQHHPGEMKITLFVSEETIYDLGDVTNMCDPEQDHLKSKIFVHKDQYKALLAQFGEKIQSSFPNKIVFLPHEQFLNKYISFTQQDNTCVIKI
jgi:hypothetical protein